MALTSVISFLFNAFKLASAASKAGIASSVDEPNYGKESEKCGNIMLHIFIVSNTRKYFWYSYMCHQKNKNKRKEVE